MNRSDARVGEAGEDWSAEYETVLCEHLPDGPPDAPLRADDRLFDLGIDSFGTVELLAAIEDRLGITLPDDELTAETFETVGSLWRAVGRQLEDARLAERGM